jgi:PIN domain nuclease of toxin-antitoxin system
MGSHEVILLDTHAAIWIVTGDAALGAQSRAMAAEAAANNELMISPISFWEIALLISKRRLQALDSATERRELMLAHGLREIPLTGDVAVLAGELKQLPGDPADRFIAATAIIHDATLMTADKSLLRWRHGLRRQNASK